MMMMMIIKEKEAINFRVGHLGERGKNMGRSGGRKGKGEVMWFRFNLCVFR